MSRERHATKSQILLRSFRQQNESKETEIGEAMQPSRR